MILSAGAVKSPQLLMLSGIGPADELQRARHPRAHDLPGVGENLQDHLDVCILASASGITLYDAQRGKPAVGLEYCSSRKGR